MNDTDELAAAAAVVAMSIDDNAEDELAVGAAIGAVVPNMSVKPSNESFEVGKENHPELPGGCEAGAANPKVPNATPTTPAMPSTQHFP